MSVTGRAARAATVSNFADEANLQARGTASEWSPEPATTRDTRPFGVVHEDVSGVRTGEGGRPNAHGSAGLDRDWVVETGISDPFRSVAGRTPHDEFTLDEWVREPN